ncbi:MAG: hypothetical protein K2K79_02275 [Paramuribaculum sp.]|nr:hypothetical protein [Paramuribaculum sp.]
MKKTLLSLCVALPAFTVVAQDAAALTTPEASWWALIDGATTPGDQATDVAVDAQGNAYWYGTYGTTATDPDVKFGGEVIFQGALYDDAQGTSYGSNYSVIKTDPTGRMLWNVYTNSGDFANNSGFCAVTSDGGVVTVAKVRHTDFMTDRNINFVDAAGDDYPVEWTCDRRYYRLAVTKLSAAGAIEWIRMIDFSTDPGAGADGNYADFWAETFNVSGGTVDADDNIYIALNYRSEVSVPRATGDPMVLTPKNVANWTGDPQATAGDFLILALDSHGYYRSNLQLDGNCAASYCQKIEYADGRLYAQGYIVGTADETLTAGGFTLSPSTVMSPLFLCLDTDLDVKWAKCCPAEQVAGKNALQNVGISVIGENLYICGQYNLKFSDPDDADKYVAATQGSVREGFIVRLDAATGEWLAARDSRDDDWNTPSALAKTGLTGYFRVFPNPLSEDKIYVFGYVMNANVGVFLRGYDANTLIADLDGGQLNIITGGGVPSCQCGAYDAANSAVYVNARGNQAFKLMTGKTSEAPVKWGVLAARFDLPKSSLGAIGEIAGDSSCDTPAEYYNLQGIRVSNPGHGIYIVRQGSKVTKILK